MPRVREARKGGGGGVLVKAATVMREEAACGDELLVVMEWVGLRLRVGFGGGVLVKRDLGRLGEWRNGKGGSRTDRCKYCKQAGTSQVMLLISPSNDARERGGVNLLRAQW